MFFDCYDYMDTRLKVTEHSFEENYEIFLIVTIFPEDAVLLVCMSWN